MNKSFRTYVLLAAAVLLGAACGQNGSDNEEMVFDTTPETDAAGVYAGEFSRTVVGAAVPDTTYAEGTLTLAPAQKCVVDTVWANQTDYRLDTTYVLRPYVVNITFKCEEFAIEKECIANISHSNGGFAFSNHVATNPLGAAFYGRIDEEGNLYSSFQMKLKSGRSTKTYALTFGGALQQAE